MSTIKEARDHIVAELLATVIGWLICLGVLSGAFAAGHWVATTFGWRESPDVIGLLSALAVLWLYEHRHFDAKLDRMREELSR